MDRLKPSKERGLFQNCFFHNSHCVKSVRIRSYSGLHFAAFGQNTNRYCVSLCIQSECGKMRIRITPNEDTFDAVSFNEKPFINVLEELKFLQIEH